MLNSNDSHLFGLSLGIDRQTDVGRRQQHLKRVYLRDVARQRDHRDNTPAESGSCGLALSLLTTTAGRRLLASLPRTGSNSTSQMSPRRIAQSVGGGLAPVGDVTGVRPFRPGVS